MGLPESKALNLDYTIGLTLKGLAEAGYEEPVRKIDEIAAGYNDADGSGYDCGQSGDGKAVISWSNSSGRTFGSLRFSEDGRVFDEILDRKVAGVPEDFSRLFLAGLCGEKELTAPLSEGERAVLDEMETAKTPEESAWVGLPNLSGGMLFTDELLQECREDGLFQSSGITFNLSSFCSGLTVEDVKDAITESSFFTSIQNYSHCLDLVTGRGELLHSGYCFLARSQPVTIPVSISRLSKFYNGISGGLSFFPTDHGLLGKAGNAISCLGIGSDRAVFEFKPDCGAELSEYSINCYSTEEEALNVNSVSGVTEGEVSHPSSVFRVTNNLSYSGLGSSGLTGQDARYSGLGSRGITGQNFPHPIPGIGLAKGDVSRLTPGSGHGIGLTSDAFSPHSSFGITFGKSISDCSGAFSILKDDMEKMGWIPGNIKGFRNSSEMGRGPVWIFYPPDSTGKKCVCTLNFEELPTGAVSGSSGENSIRWIGYGCNCEEE